MVTPEDMRYLLGLVSDLETAGRKGAPEDLPEGSRYITISHTLAVAIARKLGDIADRILS